MGGWAGRGTKTKKMHGVPAHAGKSKSVTIETKDPPILWDTLPTTGTLCFRERRKRKAFQKQRKKKSLFAVSFFGPKKGKIN